MQGVRFSNTTGILQKKNYVVYPGAEVEQQTSAPPPKKNPGSAPEKYNLNEAFLQSRSNPGIQRSLLCTKKYKKTDFHRKRLNKQ